MPDVKGLLADPEFQKLDLSTQKSALGRLDPDFASISDGDYLKFRTKLKGSMGGATMDWGKARVPTEQELETTGGGLKGNANDFLGLGVGKIAESGVKAIAEGGLKKLATKVAVPLATGATTGYLGKKGAEVIGVPEAGANVIGVLTGMAGGLLESRIGAFVRSIPDEVIGGNSWLKLAKWMASDEGEAAAAKVPKQTRDEIANQVYQETHGKAPETGHEKLQAIKEFKDRLKTQKETKPEGFKPVKPNPAIASKMKYGGPAPSEADATVGKRVGMSGALEPPPKPAPEPKKPEYTGPVQKKQGVVKTKYGGNDNPYGGQAYRNKPSRGPLTKLTSEPEEAESKTESDAAKGPISKLTESKTGTEKKDRNYSFTHPDESLTDVKKQLFSNTGKQQLDIPNAIVRERFKQLHGHGISEATYEEVQQYNEYVAKNGKLPPAKGQAQ